MTEDNAFEQITPAVMQKIADELSGLEPSAITALTRTILKDNNIQEPHTVDYSKKDNHLIIVLKAKHVCYAIPVKTKRERGKPTETKTVYTIGTVWCILYFHKKTNSCWEHKIQTIKNHGSGIKQLPPTIQETVERLITVTPTGTTYTGSKPTRFCAFGGNGMRYPSRTL